MFVISRSVDTSVGLFKLLWLKEYDFKIEVQKAWVLNYLTNRREHKLNRLRSHFKMFDLRVFCKRRLYFWLTDNHWQITNWRFLKQQKMPIDTRNWMSLNNTIVLLWCPKPKPLWLKLRYPLTQKNEGKWDWSCMPRVQNFHRICSFSLLGTV